MKIKQYLTGILYAAIMLVPLTLSSCKDDYEYDDKEPDNLGESLYDYLLEDGEFTYFLRLIDDLEYKETLSRTGSKTLFPARDEAFERFFNDNPYGAKSYEELSPAQKRCIMNSSMVNMAYLSDMLPNVSGTDGAGKGLALRRRTSSTNLDTIAYVHDERLFENPYWSRFAEGTSVRLVQEAPMIVHFTEQLMDTKGITDEDLSMILNGVDFKSGDIYVNGIKVVQKDVLCKNGYIHVLADVLLPAQTMADAIATEPSISLYNHLMTKFCAPYYDANLAMQVYEYYNGSTPLRPLIPTTDSIFVKQFFNSSTRTTDPNGKNMSSYGMLYFDPAKASLGSEQDMAVMFVPTNDALDDYISSDRGSYLRDAYGVWDSIPTDLLAMFVKNHQKTSFMASLPHTWSELTDESSYPMDVELEDVEKTIITNNGVIYIVNKVLPPIDYQGVYASVLTAPNTKIMKWAITDDWNNIGDSHAMRFYMYLRSMENMYNLIVPTDSALQYYREPISWARGGANREIWSFKYNQGNNTVTADVYRADSRGNKGAFLRSVEDKTIIRNRLTDILDMHIIIGDKENNVMSGYIDDGKSKYRLTKGGSAIIIDGAGDNLQMLGGGDREMGLSPVGISLNSEGSLCRYDSDNGRTFIIDRLLHDPSNNVYQMLESNTDFKAFFDLCLGHDQVFTYFSHDEEIREVFTSKSVSNTSGVGMIVDFFNNFRYTIFVPTEAALKKAFEDDKNLYTWEEIAADENPETKRTKTLYLLNFIRYHFVDNSVYISGEPVVNMTYETAARNEYDKFHKVTVNGDGHSLVVTDERGNEINVITEGGSYNIMARDLIVDSADPTLATGITASSKAVIHLVDNVLKYE